LQREAQTEAHHAEPDKAVALDGIQGHGGRVGADKEDTNTRREDREQIVGVGRVRPVVVVDPIEGDERVLLGRAELVRKYVTLPAALDLDAEQVVVHAVAADEDVVALADIQSGILSRVHRLIVRDDAMA